MKIHCTGRARLIQSSTLFEVSVKCFAIILLSFLFEMHS